MKYFKIMIKYFFLINQGLKFRDKIIIFSYLFFNAVPNLFRKKKNHKLLGNVTVKSKDGIFFCASNIFSIWTGSSFHEPELRKYFKLKKGVFVDVGANIGKYSILVGKELISKGKVIAFEPMPGNFEILRKNIRLNNLKNIIPLQIALGNKEKETEFYIDAEGIGGGGHSLIKKTENKILVKVMKLDNILSDLKIKKIDLIKIDVEGAEADVLLGAIKTLKKDHPKIIFEAWDTKHFSNVKKILLPLNYNIRKIGEQDYFAE